MTPLAITIEVPVSIRALAFCARTLPSSSMISEFALVSFRVAVMIYSDRRNSRERVYFSSPFRNAVYCGSEIKAEAAARSHLQLGSRENGCQFSAHCLLVIWSRALSHRPLLSIVTNGLPISVNLIKIPPYRCAQRLVSWLLLDPIKLTGSTIWRI